MVNQYPRSSSSPAKRGRGTARSAVEGVGLDQLHSQPNDRVGDIIDPVGHLACWNAHHRNALSSEPCVLSSVTFRPVGRVVAHPIDLDRKPSFAAVEVDDVRPNRMLAAKDRRPGRASPQPPP
jgi:hypothetical protein